MTTEIDRDAFLNRFKERIEALNISERKACLRAGLSPAAIKNLRERPEQLPSMKTIIAIANVLNVSPQWLAFGTMDDSTLPVDDARSVGTFVNGDPYPGSENGIIPEVDAIAGAGEGQFHTEVDALSGGIQSGHRVVAEWQVPPEITRHMMGVNPRQILILAVRGDSMEPTLRTGDRIIVDLADRRPNDGGIYVIDEGHGPIVKRIRPVSGSDPLVLEVISDNPNVGRYSIFADLVTIIGRARGRWTAI